jgi:AcrR family transcriptional regulator
MTEGVKRARSYRSPTRDRQRAATRAAILDAASRLFVERGYAATSVAAIAEAADVSPETVYAIFHNKREVLGGVVDVVATNGGATTGVVADEWLERVRAEPDQRRRFAIMTEATRDLLRRAAPIDEVVRAAANADPDIAGMQRDHDQRRLKDIRVLIGLLAEAGPLRMPPDRAVDLMWALSRSTDFYRALTTERRWTHKRAFDALNDALARVILPDP